MICKLEPAIWSRDTGQRIPYFDRCQLIITWMSNIEEVHGKPRLHVCQPIIWSMAAMLRDSVARRRRRAYAPTSNTASHDNHEKINSWVFISFLYEYWAPLGGPWGRRSSAIIILHLLHFLLLLIFTGYKGYNPDHPACSCADVLINTP